MTTGSGGECFPYLYTNCTKQCDPYVLSHGLRDPFLFYELTGYTRKKSPNFHGGNNLRDHLRKPLYFT